MPAAPKSKAIREPPALTRYPVSFLTPSQLSADQWRRLVGGAPVVRACVQTMTMLVGGLDWYLEGEDDDAKAYFTKVLENADADDGGGWEVWLSRILRDTMEVPFGGATEIGTFSDGVVAWLSHIDGATMVPTFDRLAPYAQVNPFGLQVGPPVTFKASQIGRVRWQAQSDLRAYGWTITPVQDALPAIQALLRADRFWQSFLVDGPPPGILDIPGWDDEDAQQWYDDWTTMLAGISPLKVPILAGTNREGKAAQFIEFAKSPAETKTLDLIKSYAEFVTACFGMSLGDLGLFGQELRLAGATKLMELTNRQGMAKLMRAVKQMIDLEVLPDGIEFKWAELDLVDQLRKEQAKEIGSRRLKALIESGMITAEEGKRVAIAEEIIPADIVDADLLEPSEDERERETSVTDEELGPESAPSSEKVAEDLDREERAQDLVQAFPLTSKWVNRMARLAEKLMRPARTGFTAARARELVELGLEAYGEARSDFVTRAIADSRKALEKALSRADWWKSPNLTAEVAAVLRGAYEEGAAITIRQIDASRVELGLAGVEIGKTTFNLTNKEVLALIRERAGQFIRHIDDGTRSMIVNAVVRGVREGVASQEIAKSILADTARRSLIETFRGRALSIVNTEINWAESHAALEQQQRLGLTKKRWISIPGVRCEICEANSADGAVSNDHRFRSVFGSTLAPPAHPSVCLTGDSRAAAQGIAAASKRWYDGEILILRTGAGNELRCTPNHPILTDRGWVAARELMEGGYVIGSFRPEWVAVRNHQDQDVPPSIEEIAESFRGSGTVTAVEMPTTAEHFHGDGVGSEVAIIYADGLLGDHHQATLPQHLSEFPFCARHAEALGFDRRRELQPALEGRYATLTATREFAADDRGMGGGDLTASLLRGHAVPLQELGLASIANVNATAPQRVTDRLSAYPIPEAQAVHRLAGDVFLDQVVEVQMLRDWSGHVYNLQTADGFYVANGIVTHNCHCYITFEKDELLSLGDKPSYWFGA